MNDEEYEGYVPLFKLSELALGKTYESENKESYVSLIDPSTYALTQQAEVGFSLEVSGLVLSDYQYSAFVRLLNIATQG